MVDRHMDDDKSEPIVGNYYMDAGMSLFQGVTLLHFAAANSRLTFAADKPAGTWGYCFEAVLIVTIP